MEHPAGGRRRCLGDWASPGKARWSAVWIPAWNGPILPWLTITGRRSRARRDRHDYNWFDGVGGSPVPIDYGYHGTITMGLIVGDDGAGNQIGMAPGAYWIACPGIGSPYVNPLIATSGSWHLPTWTEQTHAPTWLRM